MKKFSGEMSHVRGMLSESVLRARCGASYFWSGRVQDRRRFGHC